MKDLNNQRGETLKMKVIWLMIAKQNDDRNNQKKLFHLAVPNNYWFK